jgi:hypothetical protein
MRVTAACGVESPGVCSYNGLLRAAHRNTHRTLVYIQMIATASDVLVACGKVF